MKRLVTISISLVALIFFCTTAFRCNDDNDEEFVFMSFIIPLSMTPGNGLIKVGDTLWLTADFPDELIEFNTNKTFSIPNFNFKTRIVFNRLIGNQLNFSDQPGSADNFLIINKLGAVKNLQGTFGDFILDYNQGKYSCKIGFIPTKTGIYSIGFLWKGNGAECTYFGDCIDIKDVVKLPPSSDGKKRTPVYHAFYHVINNGEVNYDLLLRHSQGVMIESSIDDIYYLRKGTFTIQVIE
jgi:hypothetical protein